MLLAALGRAEPDLRLAWPSLDNEDNDRARFLSAFLAAVQGEATQRCGNTQTMPEGRCTPECTAPRPLNPTQCKSAMQWRLTRRESRQMPD